MSIDVVSIIDGLSYLLGSIIIVLAAFRGVQIGKRLVSKVYRNRAFWIAGLCIAIVLQSLVPNDIIFFGNLPLFVLLFFLLLGMIFVFIDSTVLVTLEMDFFHRNTLRWRQARLIAYPLTFVIAAVFLSVGALAGLPSTPAWISAIPNSAVGIGILVAFFALYGYSAAALVVGSRRTPDRTLKRHITLLGFVVIIFMVTTFIFNYRSMVPVDLLDDFLGLLVAYLLYRAVMALSPMSRIEKDKVGDLQARRDHRTHPTNSILRTPIFAEYIHDMM